MRISAYCLLWIFLALSAIRTVDLPPPTEWSAPNGAPTAPGDAFQLNCTGQTVAQSPIISEWTRCSLPDETFTLTGIRFTLQSGTQMGSDTTVWLWAKGLTVARQCTITTQSKDNQLTAQVPADLAIGMYLVWVSNQAGTSAPVCLNRSQIEWIGPMGNTAAPMTSTVKRLMGRNLSTGHGTTTSHVYLVRSGSSSFESLALGRVNPYAVECILPADLPVGTHRLYVHNGHGGSYGWSAPQNLSVVTPWQRDSYQITVNSSGGDDAAVLQSAINTLGARTNGGTLFMPSANYRIASPLTFKKGVRIRGAGKTVTTLAFDTGIEIDPNKPCFIDWGNGAHIALEDMKIFIKTHTRTGVTVGGSTSDVLMKNVEWFTQGFFSYDIWPVQLYINADRLEITGCDFSVMLSPFGQDMSIHGNNFYGAPYGEMWMMASEAGIYGNPNYSIIEQNHFETRNWPSQNGNVNYTEFTPAEDLKKMVWCKRAFAVMGVGGVSHNYFGDNTGENVAMEDNKGEQFLFHGGSTNDYSFYAQVAGAGASSVSIRADGKIDGVQDWGFRNYGTPPQPVLPNTNAADCGIGWVIAIVRGTGIGQYRTVTAATGTTLTVDAPWRLPPAADSVIVGYPGYVGNVLYNNQVNAFPPGYRATFSASQQYSFDGNCLACVAEGNENSRTHLAATITGSFFSPTMWTIGRGNRHLEVLSSGLRMGNNLTKPALANLAIGNAIIDETVVFGAQRVSDPTICPMGIIFIGETDDSWAVCERSRFSGGDGGLSGPILFRKNVVSVRRNQTWSPRWELLQCLPAAVAVEDRALFLGNTYTGYNFLYWDSTKWWDGQGIVGHDQPLPLLRVAHFQGTVGQTLAPVTIPIADAHTQNLTWSITSADPWISTTANGTTIAPEQTSGQLTVTINTAGLTTGTTWGTIQVTTASGRIATIGVQVELTAAGTTPPTPTAPIITGNGTATPTLSGTTLAGATIHVLVDGHEIGTAIANASGAWSYTLTGLSPGNHSVAVIASNSAGSSNQSPLVTVAVVTTGRSITLRHPGGVATWTLLPVQGQRESTADQTLFWNLLPTQSYTLTPVPGTTN